jgi:hypothetical protein
MIEYCICIGALQVDHVVPASPANLEQAIVDEVLHVHERGEYVTIRRGSSYEQHNHQDHHYR